MTQELRKLAERLSPNRTIVLRIDAEQAGESILALLDRLEKAEKALKVAANALSLALSDVDWRKDSPTQPAIHKAYQKAMEASK